MAQVIFGPLDITNGWLDIMATYPGAAGQDLIIENKGLVAVEIYSSASAVAPAATLAGLTVLPGETGYANQAHVYARAWSKSTILVTSVS